MAYETSESMSSAILEAINASVEGLSIRDLYGAVQPNDMTLFKMVLVEMLSEGTIGCQNGRFML